MGVKVMRHKGLAQLRDRHKRGTTDSDENEVDFPSPKRIAQYPE